MRLILIDLTYAVLPNDLDAIAVDEVARLAVAYVLTTRALIDLAVRLTGKPCLN